MVCTTLIRRNVCWVRYGMQLPRGTVNYLQSANKCLDREWEVKQRQATTLSYLLSLRLSTNEGKVSVRRAKGEP